jgi:hypothetical protein
MACGGVAGPAAAARAGTSKTAGASPGAALGAGSERNAPAMTTNPSDTVQPMKNQVIAGHDFFGIVTWGSVAAT